MINLETKIFGFSLLTWTVFIIIMVYFGYNVVNNYKLKQCESMANVEVGVITITVYYAKWCGYSRKFMGDDWKSGEWGKLQKLCKDSGKQVKFVAKTDEETEASEMKQHGINGFPSTVITKGGESKTIPGYLPAENLLKEL